MFIIDIAHKIIDKIKSKLTFGNKEEFTLTVSGVYLLKYAMGVLYLNKPATFTKYNEALIRLHESTDIELLDEENELITDPIIRGCIILECTIQRVRLTEEQMKFIYEGVDLTVTKYTVS